MDTMPDHYETHQTTTTTETSGGATRVAVNFQYLRSLPGIIKIIEMTVDLIICICVASAWSFSSTSGGGFITFVGVFGLITTLVLFLFHLFGLIYRLPGPWVLIEFGYLVGMSIFLFIAGLVAALNNIHGGGAVAASIFSFFNLVVHCVEIFLCFRLWRTSGGFYVASARSTTTAATTTTTTTTKTQEEYATSP